MHTPRRPISCMGLTTPFAPVILFLLRFLNHSVSKRSNLRDIFAVRRLLRRLRSIEPEEKSNHGGGSYFTILDQLLEAFSPAKTSSAK